MHVARFGFVLGLIGAATFGLQAHAQDKVLKIGAPLPLTGGLAPEGQKVIDEIERGRHGAASVQLEKVCSAPRP